MGAQNRISVSVSEKNTIVCEETVFAEELLDLFFLMQSQLPGLLFFLFPSVTIRKNSTYRLFVFDEENESRTV